MAMKQVWFNPTFQDANITAEIARWGCTPSASLNGRVSIFVGKVAGTVDLKLQHSENYAIWSDAKSTTIGASTDKTCTFTPSSADITSTTHGFTVGQWVTFYSTGSLPPEITAGVPYYVSAATLNTFQIRLLESPSSPAIIPSSAGSGTNTAALIREAEITWNVQTTADQTVLPLRDGLRLQAITGGGESIQIVQVQSTF